MAVPGVVSVASEERPPAAAADVAGSATAMYGFEPNAYTPSVSPDWLSVTNVVAAATASESFWPFMLPEVSMTSATADDAAADWRTWKAGWPFSVTCSSGVVVGSGVCAVTFTFGQLLVLMCVMTSEGADAAAGAATASAVTATSA